MLLTNVLNSKLLTLAIIPARDGNLGLIVSFYDSLFVFIAINVSPDHFSKFQRKMVIFATKTKNGHILDYKWSNGNKLYIFEISVKFPFK